MFNERQVQQLHARRMWTLRRALEFGLSQTGEAIVARYKQEPGYTPRSPDGLANSTQRQTSWSGKALHLRIFQKVKYALSIENGSAAHWIPKDGRKNQKMLRFVGRDGGIVFRRKVWHPGTKPRKGLLSAIKAFGIGLGGPIALQAAINQSGQD